MERGRIFTGKSVTTSVPSIAIRFHANAEHLEELYASDEETTCKSEKTPFTVSSNLGKIYVLVLGILLIFAYDNFLCC